MQLSALRRGVALATLFVSVAAAPLSAACIGDCDGSSEVTINEIVTMVAAALDQGGTCPAGDRNDDDSITVDEILAAVNSALSGCPPAPTPTATPEEPCPQRNPLRNVYYGDLHVHTTLSFDAYLWETRATPVDAYRFARGESLALPPLDAQGNGTRPVHLERPLDFAAVTDHSEYLGEFEVCLTPGSSGYDSPTCTRVRAGGTQIYADLGVKMTSGRPRRFADICGADGSACRSALGSVWQRVQDAAAQAYDRCQFTSFIAYEFSRSPGASTMHRNVIFRSSAVPLPISGFEQPTPLGLWNELQTACINAGNGCDVLAIPHNSNESNGHTFAVEYPGATSLDDQRAQARLRSAMEPLMEIYQHKGSSECITGISGIVGTDEACDFERRRPAPIEDCGDGTGQLGATAQGCVSRNDYSRGALLTGLLEGERLGVNPYRLGFVGSTDTHNGTPGFTEEWSFRGHQGNSDADPAVLLGSGDFVSEGLVFSPGGLAAIWAEENTRDSLFSALRRRETFATSGTRLAARVFGAWDLPANLCDDPNLVQIGYERGVPMGGVLGPRPTGAAPTFALTAMRDPGTAQHPSAKLARLQVIKGWTEAGERHQQVYDVAGDSSGAASVDLDTCTPTGPGADSLCAVWSDPDFDPSRPAFYTLRVIENPTCRWNTWVCNSLPAAQRPPACSNPSATKTIQERAWTSPIWYVPG